MLSKKQQLNYGLVAVDMGVFRRRLNVDVPLPNGCGVPKSVGAPNSVRHGNAVLGMAEDQPVDFPGSRMFPAEAEEPPGQV